MIDASTSSTGNGIQITGPGGSGSTVEGFKIENAKFEGILVGTAPVLTTSTTARMRAPRRVIIDRPRGVAQSGSAPGWGPGGRRFKSCLPDRKSGCARQRPGTPGSDQA